MNIEDEIREKHPEEAYVLSNKDILLAIATLEGDSMKIGYLKAEPVENKVIENKQLTDGKEENKN